MEPNKTGKHPFILTGALLAACLGTLLLFWTYKEALPKAGLSELTRKELPILDLEVHFVTFEGKTVPTEELRLKSPEPAPKELKLPAAPDEEHPQIKGGDMRRAPSLSDIESEEDRPRVADWQVIRHPIAFTIYFQNASKVLSLFDDTPRTKELFQSKFVQGVFHDLVHSTSVRAEDLHLEGAQGAFLEQLLRESLAAHAELHYDITHGKKGFIYSFVRDECPFASRALPLIGGALARSGYRVPGLKEPILEMRIGLLRIFLTQHGERIYLANGLEGLLNSLESLDARRQNLPDTPIVLTLRAEAFIQNLLPAMAGSTTFPVDLGLDLSGKGPGILQFPAGKFANHLHSRLFKGVLAAIPHDTFTALATSFYLSPAMSDEQWQQLATREPEGKPAGTPEEAGFAVVWDLNAKEGLSSDIGIVIANQSTPDEVNAFERYFSDTDLSTECGGGTVFLAASSQDLLQRMKEACASQSLSVLDWERGARKETLGNAQLLTFLNPASGMREVFLAGGARSEDLDDFEPQWKKEYEQAKEAMRSDAEKLFATLPVFAFAGSAARAAEFIRLNGFFIEQGSLKREVSR